MTDRCYAPLLFQSAICTLNVVKPITLQKQHEKVCTYLYVKITCLCLKNNTMRGKLLGYLWLIIKVYFTYTLQMIW